MYTASLLEVQPAYPSEGKHQKNLIYVHTLAVACSLVIHLQTIETKQISVSQPGEKSQSGLIIISTTLFDRIVHLLLI